MTGLPQPLAILEPCRPFEPAAAALDGERLHGFGLLLHVAVAVAVEFEEQRRRHAVAGVRVTVHRVHLVLVEQLDSRHGNAQLNGGDDRLARPTDRLERADGGRHRLRQRVQAHGDVRHDAQRALGTDEQAREIVAGRRLARAGPGSDDAAVGQDNRQSEHVLAHRAIADGRRSRCACGRHAADGGVGSGIDREHQPGVAQGFLQLKPRDARFDGGVEIRHADAHHAIHVAKGNRDAAFHSVHVAFERRACTERHNRHTEPLADAGDRRHFLGCPRKADDVGSRGRVVRLAAAMVLADCRCVGRALAEQALELVNRRVDQPCACESSHRRQCTPHRNLESGQEFENR